ncbi:hypothetical protein [Tenacibaculum maritimum]|uniref:hypothetical protein n=1 Tax=Tenacibaculum maritimum TaxID=107401 RepID=UPI0010A487B5|nr:hypothetical protein [Tenacibaculum maritimum]QCD62449.1 hypothetical protein B9C57_07790 [Tenacibaculum maritimum]
MIRLIQIFCLSLFLNACSKAKQTDQSKKGKPNFATVEQQIKEPSQKQEYFSNIEDFKKFIIDKKWVDIKGEDPCDPHGQHITVKDGYIYEYNTIEPSEYKIDKILQIDSKTLGIKIQSNSGRNVVFKVELLDLKKRLVKWIYNYETAYEAKPYDIVCKDTKSTNKDHLKVESYNTDIYNVKECKLDVEDRFKGLYYYKSKESEIEFILDSRNNKIQFEVGGDQYGYIDQLRAIQVGDTLGLFYYKNISGANYDDTRKYDFLKFYKGSDGKFYFEGNLPYLPKGSIQFDKVK